jgi:hypothetical protein
MQSSFSPQGIQSDVDVIKKQFPLVLSQFAKHTILEKTNPEISEYRSLLQGSAVELHAQTTNLKRVSERVDRVLARVETELADINAKIRRETIEEKKMARALSRLVPEENGSTILISDYTLLYNTQYAKNGLTLAMIVAATAAAFRRKSNF